jgi:hypothetical protein
MGVHYKKIYIHQIQAKTKHLIPRRMRGKEHFHSLLKHTVKFFGEKPSRLASPLLQSCPLRSWQAPWGWGSGSGGRAPT